MKSLFTTPRLLINVLALALLAISVSSCNLFDKDEDDPQPDLSITFLTGDWIRTGGNNTNGDGMELEVTDNYALIKEPANTDFSIGDKKWENINVSGPETFDYEELGSDYNYYDATITVISENEIEITVAAAGAGNFQRWVRL